MKLTITIKFVILVVTLEIGKKAWSGFWKVFRMEELHSRGWFFWTDNNGRTKSPTWNCLHYKRWSCLFLSILSFIMMTLNSSPTHNSSGKGRWTKNAATSKKIQFNIEGKSFLPGTKVQTFRQIAKERERDLTRHNYRCERNKVLRVKQSAL